MAAFLDDAIGNITGAISRAGLSDQTLVVFTSGCPLRLRCLPFLLPLTLSCMKQTTEGRQTSTKVMRHLCACLQFETISDK
jgi:hypothetical protein